MRILLCGVAAVALSGCSWMGFGSGQNHNQDTYKSHTTSSTSSDNCCVGGKSLSRWNIEGGLGTTFSAGGDVISGGKAHPAFNATRTLDNVSYGDAYDNGYRAELGGSYALNPNRKVTVQGHYENASGNDIALGTQNGNVLRGSLSDYNEFGIEAGLRQYIQPFGVPLLKSVRPYVEGKLGAAYVDDISLGNVREVGGVAAPVNVNFYEASWVPTAAGLVGIETPVFDRFTMGVETGIRYRGVQKSDNTSIENGFAQYGGANNGGSRYSVPLTLRGRYRF